MHTRLMHENRVTRKRGRLVLCRGAASLLGDGVEAEPEAVPVPVGAAVPEGVAEPEMVLLPGSRS
jgi:hypothetical protein